MMGILSIGMTTGCSSNSDKEEATLHEKHAPMPDYVQNTPDVVKEAYVMAAEHPDVVDAVPCYCNCYESAGHMSNRDCFIGEMGPNNEVVKWDAHGTA